MRAKTVVHGLEDEAAWVEQSLAGDSRGFEALIRRYHGPLRRLLRSMVRNPEDAEDLMQETFLRAYRFLHRFDPARPFGPWLIRIGANLARNHLQRRPGRWETALGGDDEEHIEGAWLADHSTLEELDYRRLREAAERALAKLPEDQRVVLEMRLLAEMSYKEISAVLQIPMGTVMSRLGRGRRRMQAELAGQTSLEGS